MNRKDYYLSYSDLYNYYYNEFMPIAITSCLLSPLTRMKILLQTMNNISISDRDKIYKPSSLYKSKILIDI